MITINKEFYPKRIICLTEESTELLYLLGEEDRIVGISGFTERPKRAKKEKPKVSTFLDAKTDEILALKPDLVIGFSDIQADIAHDLIKKGITVLINNHRSIQETLNFMMQLGTLVDKKQETEELVNSIIKTIQKIQSEVATWEKKPKVYFEEWYDPLISGITWVSEIIEIAGGEDLFSEFGKQSLAKNRIIEHPELVIERNPDIILASWCGKKFKKDKMINRQGWEEITAIKKDAIFDLPSETILQPGPAALMDALPLIHSIFKNWKNEQ
jgi:iron complex transport system substrate-binding protein